MFSKTGPVEIFLLLWNFKVVLSRFELPLHVQLSVSAFKSIRIQILAVCFDAMLNRQNLSLELIDHFQSEALL